MIAAAALALALGAGLIAVLWLIRLVRGPAPLDRAAAAFALGQACVVLLGALCVALARSQWLEIAFSVLIGSLVMAICALKLARYNSLQPRLGVTRIGGGEAQ